MAKEVLLNIKNDDNGSNVEAAHEAALSYQEFWSEFLEDHPGLRREHEEFASIVKHNDKTCRRMEERILSNWHLGGVDLSTEAKNFYYRLGSLNNMQGAEDVAAKAGMVLERRAEARTSTGRPAMYELLLSGCLFNEAAMVSEGNFRASMLGRALSQYDQTVEQGGNDLMNSHVQRALRLGYDVQFLRIFDAANKGNIDELTLKGMHEDLQLGYIDEFLMYLGQIDGYEQELRQKMQSERGSSRDDIAKQLAGTYLHSRGIAFEWFSVMSYRRYIDSANLHKDSYIRTAFPREEEPWFFKTVKCDRAGKRDTKQMPKHGFDNMLIRRGADGGFVYRPLQLKVGAGHGDYLPEISKVAFSYKDRHQLLDVLRRSAVAMRKEYTNQPLSPGEAEALETTTDLLQPRLMAA